MDRMNNRKLILIGAGIGAFTGILAAYLLIKRANLENAKEVITPGEGVKLGLGILSLLKLISEKSS